MAPPVKIWTRLNWWNNFHTIYALATPPRFKFCGQTYVSSGYTLTPSQLIAESKPIPFRVELSKISYAKSLQIVAKSKPTSSRVGVDGRTGLLRFGTTPGGTAIVGQESINASGMPICPSPSNPGGLGPAWVQTQNNFYHFYVVMN